MKDKLIELIDNLQKKEHVYFPLTAEDITDYLLANGVIVLPFPIGTTYYRIVTKRGKVGNPYFSLIRTAKLNWYSVEKVLADLGKTVFLTKEEAEKALEKMLKERD